MRAAIYVRVSTREQAEEGFSISAQRQRLEAYCESQGWEIAGYFVDEGVSAKDTNRDELKRMIKHIENGLIDVVLVYKLDRLTRSVLDLYELLKTFDKHDCKFKSATEVYDTTTAIGRLFLTLVAALAQWERENLSERVSMGIAEKARQGKWAVNRGAPFGYDLNKEKDLIINESESKVVNRIYNLYIAGKGDNKIASILNDDIIKGEAISPRREQYWSGQTVRYILRNPIYVGTGRWNYRRHKDRYFEIEDMAPPIISDETFEKAMKIRERRRNTHPRRATSPFVFSGIAKCAKCGAPLMGKYGGKKDSRDYYNLSYVCSQKRNGLCDVGGVLESYIEGQFLKVLGRWDVSSEARSEAAAGVEKETDEEQVNSLKKEMSAIEKRRRKWQYAWANDTISDEDFTARMEEENEKEKQIRAELESCAYTPAETTPDEMEKILSDLHSNWSAMETAEKKSFMQLFFKSFTVRRVNRKRNADCVRIENIELY